ncbi:MAG: hypothetical protein GW763_09035 [Paraglaciecola sp.]|nr:hypothetical protein [Paraglaciecola sp.]NCT48115.1 hypothetical protein [Paraglaciecola sp.]
MTERLTYKDKYAEYQLHSHNQIIFSTVKGVVGVTVAQHFVADFCRLGEAINAYSWGYCADLSACDGYTEEACSLLIAAHKFAMTNRCIVDAYQMTSPLLISQTKNLRIAAGIDANSPLQTFAQQAACVQFINNVLRTVGSTT